MLKQSLNINEIRSLLGIIKKFNTNLVEDKLFRFALTQELGNVAIKLERKLIQFAIKPINSKKTIKVNWSITQLLALRELVKYSILFYADTSFEYNLLIIISNNINQLSV